MRTESLNQALTGRWNHLVGTTECGKVYVTTELSLRDGKLRLSITGVEGPKRNGDCKGGCGQIIDTVASCALSDAFSEDMRRELVQTWRDWHLNDMRAGCEHQRAEGWNRKPIDPEKPLETYGKNFDGQRQASWNMLVWVSRKEHPEGLLSHPCPMCGYKYGTAWLHDELPDSVIRFIRRLPRNDTNPWD